MINLFEHVRPFLKWNLRRSNLRNAVGSNLVQKCITKEALAVTANFLVTMFAKYIILRMFRTIVKFKIPDLTPSPKPTHAPIKEEVAVEYEYAKSMRGKESGKQ